MASATDDRVIGACRAEKRCLVTLDVEFGNPFLYKPSEYSGIAVLRLPARPTMEDLKDTVRTLLAEVGRVPIAGRLWTVEIERIRVYQPGDDEMPQEP
ncbi:MAG: DUF5615 family PIN-like protein [Thermoanaerobaculia bacterium]